MTRKCDCRRPSHSVSVEGGAHVLHHAADQDGDVPFGRGNSQLLTRAIKQLYLH